MNHNKSWTNHHDQYVVDNYTTESLDDMAAHLGRTSKSVRSRLFTLELTSGLKQFALYKGEDLIVIGTVPEIAAHQNVKVETVYYYSTPANLRKARKGATHNRKVVVRA